nr:InfA [Citropsis articulata]
MMFQEGSDPVFYIYYYTYTPGG